VNRWLARIRHLPSIGRLLAPGTMDAGLSSTAGFLVAIYAARTLSTDEFGAYGLLFAASILARDIPQQLYFAPARIRLLPLAPERRLGALPGTMLRGGLVGVLPAATVPLVGLALSNQVDGDSLFGLGVTAGVLTLVGPLFDHQRASFHHSQRSWFATVCSMTNLFVVVIAVFAAHQLHVDPVFVPFGALTLGAIAGFLVGGSITRALGVEQTAAPTLKSIRLLGLSLAANQMLAHMAGLVAALLVATIVSADALGYAEGARIAGQPLMVLATGIQAVLHPRVLEAGRRGDRASIRYYSRVIWLVLALFTVPYLLMFGVDHRFNPLGWLLPVAYQLPGLAALYIVHNASAAAIQPPMSVLVGMERVNVLLRSTAIAVGISVAASAASAPFIGGYSRILGPLLAVYVRGFIVHDDMRRELNRQPIDSR
jgi:O-antigen/teichoic acid export membrane protein